jgi:hypothetical protein
MNKLLVTLPTEDTTMSKLHVALACAMAIVLVLPAQAQDQPRDDQVRQDQPQQLNDQTRIDNPQERNDPSRQEQLRRGQPTGDMDSLQQARPDPMARPDPGATGLSAEYSAELSRCDQMSGNQKTQCIESVMKKFGQM